MSTKELLIEGLNGVLEELRRAGVAVRLCPVLSDRQEVDINIEGVRIEDGRLEVVDGHNDNHKSY